jgi:hypothetical protein
MAIAYDNFSTGNASTTATVSHANAGNTLLCFIVGDYAGDNLTSVTYNGVAMTFLDKHVVTGDRWNYSYIMQNAPVGTYNVVATISTSNGLEIQNVSYSGCATTGQPDAHTVNSGTGSGSLTATVTTTTAGDWLVGKGVQSSSGVPTAGAGTTLRGTSGAYSNEVVGDTNGAVSVGSNSLLFTGPGTGFWLDFVVALKPAASAAVVHSLSSLGAGA